MNDISRHHKRNGFTFVEILVVVVIIMILTVGIITVGTYVRKKAKIDETKSIIHNLSSALQEYKNYREANFPGYPDGNVEYLFRKLNEVPNCRKIVDKIPSEKLKDDDNDGVIDTVLDAWDRGIGYFDNGPGNFPTIISAGPDGEPGNADDISSDKL